MEIKSVNNETKYVLQMGDSGEAQTAEEAQIEDSEAKERDASGPWTLWSELSSKPKTLSMTAEGIPDPRIMDILKKYSNNPKKWSALNYAIEQRDFESARVLTDYVIDLNRVDDSWSPIFRIFINAMSSKEQKLSEPEINLIQILIEKGVDVKWNKKSGYSPLSIAVYMGRDDLVSALLKNGANVNEPQGLPIHDAVDKSNYKIATFLIQAGANLDPDTLGVSPLCTATGLSDIEMVRLLLTNGANPNAKNTQQSNSILGLALMKNASDPSNKNSTEIIELLLQYGAKLS